MDVEVTTDQLVETCAEYLAETYGEQLLEYDILSNSAQDGDGQLTMECTVRAGASTSRWQKTFTFREGEVTNMTWRYLG